MRLRGIAALCSLAFAQALYAAPADDVQALLEKGDAKAAYELGRKHRDQLGNPAFDFYFGIAAIDSGNAGEGVLALERYVLTFPDNVCLPTTYLNDVRFNLNMGPEGTAFITDSSDSGANGIIVVDIASGESWRRLNDHPSTKADQNFTPIVEGQPLMARMPGQPPAYLKIGSDGIAISPDGKTLCYCPLASRRLYSVSTEALADRNRSDQDVAGTVKQLLRPESRDGVA